MKVDRRLNCITLDYWHCFPLLSITLTISWQLLLVFYNAKAIQLSHCNRSCKGDHRALNKRLCWEFWGKSHLCLDYILGPFDVCYNLLGISL